MNGHAETSGSRVVDVRGLRKAYGGRIVFDGFDLSVEPRETVAILGASGCGKSTLLRIIAHLVPPDAGSIEARGEIGYVFQEPRLMPWLDVRRNVAFAARNAAERARVPHVLDLVQIAGAATLWPKALSGGMAQRVALARSLVREPQVLLLDEPLSALDALLRMELQTALARIVHDAGCAAVLVTHDVDEALVLADRVIVLAGAPARVTLAVDVPLGLRRARERAAELVPLRVALLEALGVVAPEHAAAEPYAAGL